ncbi:hypothetical protein BD310DRAFT_937860 [Dichomitus squalens]|uniref:Uncharacterized protein n=1 Tax=Dichomitus squalens TaxID=114155 RepID=A0A4Q9PF09_9APHY|nr:hypothetical protein BD310DRAFT_937860 [Dichomitus squalens]
MHFTVIVGAALAASAIIPTSLTTFPETIETGPVVSHRGRRRHCARCGGLFDHYHHPHGPTFDGATTTATLTVVTDAPSQETVAGQPTTVTAH